jgi:hypothetical protein
VRLQRSVGSSRLSAEHLYFCGYPNVTQELQPSCSSAGMLIKDGATALARLVNQGQVPVPDDCFEFVPKSVWDPRRDCKARTSSCSNSPLVSMLRAGRLTWLPLSSMWQMQQHIRSFGSIVCPITLSPTLRTNASVAAVYNGPGVLPGCILCTAATRAYCLCAGGHSNKLAGQCQAAMHIIQLVVCIALPQYVCTLPNGTACVFSRVSLYLHAPKLFLDQHIC